MKLRLGGGAIGAAVSVARGERVLLEEGQRTAMIRAVAAMGPMQAKSCGPGGWKRRCERPR